MGEWAVITDHLYDCGPAEETGGPCMAGQCGKPRSQHAASEYDHATAGSMHEPKAYPASKLDWNDPNDQTHPFFD